jgi:hypothetical protein
MENFVVCDLPGFAEFANRVPKDERAASADRLRLVGRNDLRSIDRGEMEALIPASRAWRTKNSVIGTCPNVPHYLAGNPYNMRLKRRSTSATAPLWIFVELVASAGVDTKTCLKRGAAMLALLRILANVRPVELWCVIAIGQRKSRSASVSAWIRHPSIWRAAPTCSPTPVCSAHWGFDRLNMNSMRASSNIE